MLAAAAVAAAPPIVVTTSTWVACERCEKWRRLPPGTPAPDEEAPWFCELNPDPIHNTCDAPQEPEDPVMAPGPAPPPPDLAPFVTLPGTRAAATLAPPPPKATEAVARLLSGGGGWEGPGRKAGGGGAAAATSTALSHHRPPPAWVWEVLATSAPGPTAAAVAAADAASVAAYFGDGTAHATLARVALLGAAAASAPACLGGALAELAPGLVVPLGVEEEGGVEEGGKGMKGGQ